jgi:S1-C subfamily serine protease
VTTTLGFQHGSGAGTGLVLTAVGEVLTNNHVIRGATKIRVSVPGTGQSYRATVVGYDVAADIAVLKLIGASGLQAISLGGPSTTRSGDNVTSVGNAGGSAGAPTKSKGRITAVDQTISAADEYGNTEQLTGLIEIDADLVPGDSGGALVNAAGYVIGMDTAARSNFGAQRRNRKGYAIPIMPAIAIAARIVAGDRHADIHVGPTPFLGVLVQVPGTYVVHTIGGGLLVAYVDPTSPAWRAGITPGYTIVSLDGHAVTSSSALTSLVLRHAPGDRVQLGLVDGKGNARKRTVTLGVGPPL